VSEYIISRPSIRDLESISSYFAEVNVEAGERFLRGFNKHCQQLTSFPKMGRGYDDVCSGLRGLTSLGFSGLCPHPTQMVPSIYWSSLILSP
jgi:toxin ParE1/3/4